MTITTTTTPSPIHTHAMIPIQLTVRFEVGAILEDGSKLLSSGTLTDGREIELEDSELEDSASEEELDALDEASGVEERERLEVDGLLEAVCELLGAVACEEGGATGGVDVAGDSDTGGAVDVVEGASDGVSEEGGVSGDGSTTGVVGSGVGSTAGGADSGVRPITCC